MDVLDQIKGIYTRMADFAPRLWFGIMIILLIVMSYKIFITKTWEWMIVSRNLNRDKFTLGRNGRNGQPWGYNSTMNRAVEQGQSAIGAKMAVPEYDLNISGFKSNREQPAFWYTPSELGEYQSSERAAAPAGYKADLMAKEGLTDDKLMSKVLQGY